MLHSHDRKVSQASNQQDTDSHLCFFPLLFDPEDEGSTFLRNFGNFYQTTQRHDIEGCTPHSHRFDNLKSNRRN
jgi:hypothetical protein